MKKTGIWFFIIASILFFAGCGKSDGTVQEITPNQIYTDVDKSVVLLLIIKKNETTSGTAFFIDENGTCVTNYHVIKDGEEGIIQLYDGTTANVEKVVGYDEKADIAILSTSAENTIPVTISKTTPQTGDLVYSIGYKSVSESGVYDSTFNEGIVQKTRIINGNSYIQSTVNIVKGNSGGVLINKYGEIIGITSANESFEKYTGINLSIPIKEIDNVSRDIYEPLDIVTKRHYPVKITFYKQGKIYQKQETEYENKAKEPKEPNETGYVFLGWFSNSSFTEKYDFNKPVLENIYLYAKMEPIQYELVYDLVSGKWQQNIPSDTYTIENSGEKLPIPVRQGSLFEGWKDSEGNFYDVFPEPYDLKNMHLIASWIDGSEGLVLKSIGSEISIAGFAGNEKEVTVPQLYRNKPVTKIEARAFANSSQLERINLSKNVKYICTNAFDNCESLKELIVEEGNENFIGKDGILYLKENCEIFFVPNKLTGDITILEGTNEIKENAFYNRINLMSITILGGEKNIKENAFVGCINLSRIIGLAMNVSTVSRQAKPNDFEVIITSGENIRERAFSECGGLTSITIAASITSIGNHAFEKCIGLKSIHYMGDISKWCEIEGLRNLTLSTRELFIANNKIEGNLVLPDGTAYISSGAFCGCTGLTSITIPDSVINIGRSAFSGCTSLKNVKIGDGVINIDDSAFSGCINLENVEIGIGVKEICSGAFYNCSSLKKITVPNNVKKIEYVAFGSCTGLEIVMIGDNVESIDNEAFNGCQELISIKVSENNKSYTDVDGILYDKEKTRFIHIPDALSGNIEIPNGITVIESFSGRIGLTSIIIPESVTSICYGAFSGCSGLINLTIPFVETKETGTDNYPFLYMFGKRIYDNAIEVRRYTSTGYYSYYIPSSLKSVTVTGGNIPARTFSGCAGLTHITIPENVTEIGSDAFFGCTGLTSITIPNSVTAIEPRAFSDCTGLVNITISNSVTKIEESVFSNCTSLTNVTIPNSVTEIGYSAFSGCTRLTSITMPNSVTKIGYSSFLGCTNLKKVKYIGTLEQWNSISIDDGNDALKCAELELINGNNNDC